MLTDGGKRGIVLDPAQHVRYTGVHKLLLMGRAPGCYTTRQGVLYFPVFSHFRTHSGAFAFKYTVTPVPTGLSKGLVRTEVAVINIPPRHFVHMQLTGSFDTTEVVVALTGGRWKRVELVGKLHRGLLFSRSKPYRKTIATP